MEVLHKSLMIFSIILMFSVLLAISVQASECASPKMEWQMYSCWDTALGTSTQAIEDSMIDNDKWNDHVGNLEVVNNPPAGGPPGENALKIHWDAYNAGSCEYGSNAFVSYIASLPNPYYIRFYFYSGDLKSPFSPTHCWGRKWIYTKNSAGYNCGIMAEIFSVADNNYDDFYVLIKNNAWPSDGRRDCRDCRDITSLADWPGKVGDGLLHNNQWYSMEMGTYQDNNNGWIKVWLNGNLIINANKDAFDAMGNSGSGYDTDNGHICDWIEIPSFRNGGVLSTSDEYFSNFIISSQNIGPVGVLADTTPPGRSGGSPSGTLPAGTTSTTLSLTTDEPATCRYSTTPGVVYSSMTGTFSTTGGTSHSTIIPGLQNGNTYNYYVRCQDTAGNANTNDYTITFSVATSSSSPTIAVDSTYPGYSTSVIDDSIINATGGTSTTWASNDDSTQPHWIAVTFPSQTQITYANIWWAYNGYQGKLMTSQRVDVQYWNGSDYVTAANILYPGLDVANSSADFPAVSTTSLRFYQPANMGPPTYSRVLWITEIDYGYLSDSCIHKSDTDCNSCVDTTELSAFIDRWKVNNQDVTLKELIEAIGLWKRGCT